MRFLKDLITRRFRQPETAPLNDNSIIKPKDMISRLTVEELSLTADQYFKSVSDPIPLMANPFWNLADSPQLLEHMGFLLSGLHIGKTMKILEFGAGTCWLSRYLNQLQCRTISCDVSKTALEMGKRLFQEFPIAGESVSEPEFLVFDGHTLDLPDHCVDRIICNDAFHHVPNQEEVLSELARVLKPGGIAGFAEPGRYHSQSPNSQFEMKTFNVLENDIHPDQVFAIAKKHGFTDIRFKLMSDMDVALNQLQNLTGPRQDKDLIRAIKNNIKQEMTNRTVFFLYKGKLVRDSRAPAGLSHSIKTENCQFQVPKGENLYVPIRITNTGSAKWMIRNIKSIGVVNIGTHLYDENQRLINFDFSRHRLTKPVEPGEAFDKTLVFNFCDRGHYRIAIDMVSEGIAWFEKRGSQPKIITIIVN